MKKRCFLRSVRLPDRKIGGAPTVQGIMGKGVSTLGIEGKL